MSHTKAERATIPPFSMVYHAPSGKWFVNSHRKPVTVSVTPGGTLRILTKGAKGCVTEDKR